MDNRLVQDMMNRINSVIEEVESLPLPSANLKEATQLIKRYQFIVQQLVHIFTLLKSEQGDVKDVGQIPPNA